MSYDDSSHSSQIERSFQIVSDSNEKIQLVPKIEKNTTLLGKDSLGKFILNGDVFYDFRTKTFITVTTENIKTLSVGFVIDAKILENEVGLSEIKEYVENGQFFALQELLKRRYTLEELQQRKNYPTEVIQPRKIGKEELKIQQGMTAESLANEAMRSSDVKDFPAHLENIRTQLAEWKKYQEQMQRADTFIIPTSDGLGDCPYVFLMARILAKSYPNKKIIVIETNKMLRPMYAVKEENMEIIPSYEDLQKTLLQQKTLSTVILDIMPNGFNMISRDYIDEVLSQLQREKAPPKERQKPSRSIRSFFRGLRKGNDQTEPQHSTVEHAEFAFIPSRPPVFFGEEGDRIRLSIWRAWSYLAFQGEEQGENTAAVHSSNELSQLETIAGQMTTLLGCDSQIISEVLMENPFKPTPEMETAPEYDLVIAYESKAGIKKGLKCLFPDQLKETLRQVKEKNPNAKIGIIIGKGDNELARMVLEANSDIEIIDGSFEYVLGACLKAKVVVSPDTSIAHVINFYKRTRQALAKRIPKLIAAFGLESGYSPWFYGPDAAEAVLITDGPAYTADTNVFAGQINYQLAS